jgi:DNA-binding FadR family transcriptional regulator
MIQMLGIPRSSLRRALEQLEREGAIWRHVGKGTFVSYGSTSPAAGDPFAGLGHQLTPYRMMRARLCIEPALAREAAINASREALTRIATTVEGARAAASWAEYERQDDNFHRAIAEAADNVLLLALFDALNRVRREVAWGAVTRSSARPPQTHSSFAEHEAIAAAIEAHDADAAYQAMRRHLQSVRERLFGDL